MNSLSVIRVIARYLENEVVTYVSLTQSKSTLVKGVAKRMLQVRRSDVFIDNSYHCLYSFFSILNQFFSDPEGQYKLPADRAGELRIAGEDDQEHPQ